MADSLVARARAAAWRDANAESAALFADALRRAPARRSEWLREYADQLTYSGRADDAIPLYREALARPGMSVAEERQARFGLALALSWDGALRASLAEYDAWLRTAPYDVEARLGRARVLSWMNRNGDAKRIYEDILHGDPRNLEAQRNYARVQSWRSRHRDAEDRLRQHLALYPSDTEAALFLAQSQHWLGRPDRAARTLQTLLARHPHHPRAQQLANQLDLQAQPSASLRYDESHQSDDLTIRTLRAWSDWSFFAGRTTLGPRLSVQHYDPDAGAGITTTGAGAFGRHRFHDALEWTTRLSVDRWRFLEDSHVRLTYDSYLTLWPNDVLRIDMGSNRTTFDNLASLRENIVATYGSVGVDVLPNELLRFVGRFNWGDYSDGNERAWGQLIAERRLRTHPRVVAGVMSTAFRFSQQNDNGYYNPRRYVANAATLRAYSVRSRRLGFDLGGMAGAEHASPAEDHFIWSLSAELRLGITSRSSVVFRGQHFSSATASSSGFARTTWGVAWRAPL